MSIGAAVAGQTGVHQPQAVEQFCSRAEGGADAGDAGALVEGRVCYGAFVLDNKAKAIYYQAQSVTEG